MTNDSRVQREIEQRVRNTNRNMPPVPDFVRPVFKDRFEGPPPISVPDNSPPQKEKASQTYGFDFLKMFNIKNIKIDNDVILIIIFILVLSAEESDKLLLFALVYIML